MSVNARDIAASQHHKILAVGDPGSGKSAQILTLPGKKFVYAFDPGTLPLLATYKCDADVEEFLPDISTISFNLVGFNKGSKSDKSSRKSVEPAAYVKWEEHFNTAFDDKTLAGYDWIVIDSLTLFTRAMMARLLFLNNRVDGIEELSDYRVVGNKLAQIFTAISSMKSNLYVTGHIQTFQDETTKRITTQLGIPGQARDMLPKLFSNIWLLQASTDEKQAYTLLTKPEPRGFQAIRTVIPNLPPKIDVTIKDFRTPENYGIGAILRGVKLAAVNGPRPVIAATPLSIPTVNT